VVFSTIEIDNYVWYNYYTTWGCYGFDRINGDRIASRWQSLNASVKYNWKQLFNGLRCLISNIAFALL